MEEDQTDRAPATLLEIAGLTVETAGRSGEKDIGLRNVSLSISKNEVVALVGESGCGNSLLGQFIVGVTEKGTRVLSGSGNFVEVDLMKLRGRKRRQLRRHAISLIPRNPEAQFNPDRTVQQVLRETVRLMGRNQEGVSEADWSDCFYRVGIVEPERVLPKQIKELPLLMIRKLGLMRALIARSQLLVCDHVLASLDRVAASQFIELLCQLREESEMAVLILSGSLRGVDQYADKVVMLYEGGVIERGDACDLLANPSHLYTKEFLSCLPNVSQLPRELSGISREAIQAAEETIHRSAVGQ